jgi:predicted metal-binding membrane protein
MPDDASILEAVLRRDRAIVIVSLVTVIGLAWGYLLMGAGMDMSTMEMSSQGMDAGRHGAHAALLPAPRWTPGHAVVMFVMWWVMMLAMMLPSAAPMLLLFARVNRAQHSAGAPFVPTGLFASGYLAVWGVFSTLAVALQGGLEYLGLLSAMMGSASPLLSASLLCAAGVYQLTPVKYACLRHCRNPFQFVTHHWRTGKGGAWRMGLEHGVYCLGCCWFLMALLFVGGVMNLYWIIGLAVFILLEKTMPAGHWLDTLTGIGLMVGGLWIMTGIRL